MIVVENGVQLTKFVSVADQMPHCKAIILYTSDVTPELLAQAREKFDVYFWNEFMELGEQNQHAEELQRRMDVQGPGSTIGLIYTRSVKNVCRKTYCSLGKFGLRFISSLFVIFSRICMK